MGCPSWLPGRYVRSRSGKAAAYVVVTNKRDEKTGEQLLRLRFLEGNVLGPPIWTVSKLHAAGSRFLKRRPRAHGGA